MSTFADATMSASEFLREHGNGEAQPVGLTEDELALEFMRRHGDTLRDVAGVGRVDALGWHPMGIVRPHYKSSISRVPSAVMPPRGCPRASYGQRSCRGHALGS